MSSLYGDLLLEHYRNPRNYGSLPSSTRFIELENPVCGDHVRMDIAIKNSKIEAIAFSGDGCVFSKASASLLTEYAKGKTKQKLLRLDRKFMVSLTGIEPSPTRLKCLLLPLEALQKVLIN